MINPDALEAGPYDNRYNLAHVPFHNLSITYIIVGTSFSASGFIIFLPV